MRNVIERARLDRIKDLKKHLEDAKHELEVAQRQGQYEKASQLRFSIIPDLERQLPKDGELKQENAENPLAMLHDRVTSNDISRVVAKATGIPVQNLLRGEREKLVHVGHSFFTAVLVTHVMVQMEDALRKRVVGQDHVVSAISDAVRISRAGLQAPNRPVASFLFLGPTGVGKVDLHPQMPVQSSAYWSPRPNFRKLLRRSCSMMSSEDCKSTLSRYRPVINYLPSININMSEVSSCV